jgi:peroxiredoxin Q/BCP
MSVQVGSQAPDVGGLLSDGSAFRVRAHRGSPLVLFFYPKDFTPGCTAEVCSFRDAFKELSADKGAVIVGVSRDDPASHRRFREEYKLPYDLVTDDGEMAKAFGATWLGGLLPVSKRMTFVIDDAGVVRGVFHHELMGIDQHVADVRAVLATLSPAAK